MNVPPRLFDFVETDTERLTLETIDRLGSCQLADAEMGKARSAASAVLCRVKKRAALKGYSPEHDMRHTVPDGFTVKGVSTYYDSEWPKYANQVQPENGSEPEREMLIEGV
jgi:hypothetical protein